MGHSRSAKTSTLKVWAGTASILVGILVSMIVILGNGANPLLFYEGVFKYSFASLFKDVTLTTFAIFIVGGLSVAVAFKIKFLNIGVSGQMMLAGSLIMLLGIVETKYSVGSSSPAGYKMNPQLFMIISFFIAIFAGMIACGIAGVLKACFHINEVVTTIMMNYTIYYLTKWIFVSHSQYYDASSLGSRAIDTHYNFLVGGFNFIIPLIISLVLATGIFILYRYTTFGFRTRSLGISYRGSALSGISVRRNVIYTSLLSGALAGLMGYFYYIVIAAQISYTSGLLPSIGFSVIAVSLVAFNNPLGIILVGILWAILSQGSIIAANLPYIRISTHMGALIFGIVIYMASISVVFYQLGFIAWLRRTVIYFRQKSFVAMNQELKIKIRQCKKAIKSKKVDIKSVHKHLSVNEQRQIIKGGPIPNTVIKDYKSDLVMLQDLIRTWKRKIKYNKTEAYKLSIYATIKYLKREKVLAQQEEIGNSINSFNDAMVQYQIIKNDNNLRYQLRIHKFNNKINHKRMQWQIRNNESDPSEVQLIDEVYNAQVLFIKEQYDPNDAKFKINKAYLEIDKTFQKLQANLKSLVKSTAENTTKIIKELKETVGE